MANKVKRILQMIHGGVLCVYAVILNGCLLDETPADIHQTLIPKIAQELIASHKSDLVKGLPPHVERILKEHTKKGITFEIGAPQMSSETGIRFYSREEDRLLLIIGLDLNASKNGYIVSGVSE